jgi:hypothetical protein
MTRHDRIPPMAVLLSALLVLAALVVLASVVTFRRRTARAALAGIRADVSRLSSACAPLQEQINRAARRRGEAGSGPVAEILLPEPGTSQSH